ncbi:hypothetical protein RND81_11G145300 [Saponaria officinalis]|uniref:Uncharacterized protein n=1 Tax=Saponaria officinalis TaxID=3572 RepID=A0AAW1HM05_SAPOF
MLLSQIEKDEETERLKMEILELQKSKRQLLELVGLKDAEISEKNSTIKSYLDKISDLTDRAAQREARVSEVEAELLRCRAHSKKLMHEKELIEKHKTWLNAELTTKTDNLLEQRRKSLEFEADMSAKLDDIEKHYNECSTSLTWHKERVRELESKLESLQRELCSARDDASAAELRYSAEMSTVSKLADLYKESSEEWSKKAGELEGVIKALETHLSQSESDYKDKLEKEAAARKEVEREALNLSEKVSKLEAELESSRKNNELDTLPLRSFTTEYLIFTDCGNDLAIVPHVPAGVSGITLAASLLREGWSLAKMYAKYQETADALQHEQMGRKQTEAILERVLFEVEEKASANLEKIIRELKAEVKKYEREYNYAQKEITDLQKQVTILLKECRDVQLQCGSVNQEYMDDDVAASFTRWMMNLVFRSLSDEVESREMQANEQFKEELQKHKEEAASRVAAVLEREEEQGRMIESLHASVSMFRRLYEEEHRLRSSDSQPAVVAPSTEWRKYHMFLLEGSKEATKRTKEAATAVAQKDEALASALSEITALKEDTSNKASQLLAMEVQVSALKEDLDRAQRRAHEVQANYKRQVILQSETIQELTKTLQTLSSVQEEASALQKQLTPTNLKMPNSRSGNSAALITMPNPEITIPNPHDATSPLTSLNLAHCVKLTSSNYTSWRFQLTHILFGFSLLGFIDGSNPKPAENLPSDDKSDQPKPNPAYHTWLKQDGLILGALMGTLAPTIQALIVRATTSKEAWDILAQTFANPSRTHINQIKDRLDSIVKTSTQTVTEYMHAVKACIDQLALMGKVLDPEDVISKVLRGLDYNIFKPVIDAIRARDTPISFEALHEKLLQHQQICLAFSTKTKKTIASCLKQEKLHLQSQLERAMKAAKVAEASLGAEHANSRSLLFTEDEFKALKLQVSEMSLLRESNMQLREENKHNFEECHKLREVAQIAKVEAEKLRTILKETEMEVEGLRKEVELHKKDKENLEREISDMREASKNLNLEEYNRLKSEVEKLRAILRGKEAGIEDARNQISQKQELISKLNQDLASTRLELSERGGQLVQVKGLKLDVERQKKVVNSYKRRVESLLKEKEALSKEKESMLKEKGSLLNEKEVLGKKKEDLRKEKDSLSKEKEKESEEDARINILEFAVTKLRKEKEKRQGIEKSILAKVESIDVERKKFEDQLERQKEAVRKISDETEKLKHARDSLPVGTSVVQLLSANNLDDLAAAYVLAIENFEREAHLVLNDAGNQGVTSTIQALPLEVPKTASLSAPLVYPPAKATKEREKNVSLHKSRKLVRPRLVKAGGFHRNIEMSGADASSSAQETEKQSSAHVSSELHLRKRPASPSPSEKQEEHLHPGDSKSLQQDVQAPAAASENVDTIRTVEELLDAVGDVPQDSAYEDSDFRKDVENAEGQRNEAEEPLQTNDTKTLDMESENIDEQDDQQPMTDINDREEGEMLPSSHLDVGDDTTITGSQDGTDVQPEHSPAASMHSPSQVDDDMDVNEATSPEISNANDQIEEGELAEDVAEDVDKSNSGDEQDNTSEPGNSTAERTVSTVESVVSRETSQEASLASHAPRTINISDVARQRAAARLGRPSSSSFASDSTPPNYTPATRRGRGGGGPVTRSRGRRGAR